LGSFISAFVSGTLRITLTLAKDKYVVAGGWKDIKIWDVVTGLPQQTLRGHQGHVLALHGDENTIVSGGEDCTIRLWDPTTGECLRIIEVGMPVFAVHLFKETLYVGGLDGCLHKWNISTGRVLEARYLMLTE
jgi:WD40 repeat protein